MFARFFIDRPVFATVISIVIVLLGLVAWIRLPIAQYPEVAPPTISVTTTYPGASARVVAETVATPLEQEINGVERMLYMSSRCTNDGAMSLDITFELGTNLDDAQVLVQNRVAIAMAKLPDEVKRQGVTTKKRSPSILLAINLISPNGRYDQLYLSNFVTLQIKDPIARVKGVGDVSFLGARDYSMRVWLDPEKLAARDMLATDVIRALQEQNVQVAAGRLGQPPAPAGVEVQLPLNALGRLLTEQQFADIIIKTGDDGQITRIRDVARAELGAKNYDVSSYLDGQPCATLAVFQLPGSNATETAANVKKEMRRLRERFPDGVEYKIVYDTTVFINESIDDVFHTLIEAFILVFIVVLVFLQDWRATILPMIDVPVSLVGTLAIMALLGFTLNNLTLFGLVLAIGIVVDDAIVVLENVETWMARGYEAREATARAMDEITGPVIAITLVLCSVFVPTTFLTGITGQFYRQFALTIAASTAISAINAMTMTPSRCVQIFGGTHGHSHKKEALPWWGIAALLGLLCVWLLQDRLAPLFGIHLAAEHDAADEFNPWPARALQGGLFLVGAVIGLLAARPIGYVLNVFLAGFNRVFDAVSAAYGKAVGGVVRLSVIMLILYGGLMGITGLGFRAVPGGFIPEQDKGYLVVSAQLPDGASLERTEVVARKIDQICKETPGVAHRLSVPGYSLLTSVNLPNAASMFVILDEFENRRGQSELSANAVMAKLRMRFATEIREAVVVAFGAPPVEGVGSTGGFKLQVQDRGAAGFEQLQGAVRNLSEKANQQPGLIGVFSTFTANQPQLFVDVDRTKAKAQKVALDDVFSTLQANLGSAYVNDFTRFGRNWQVTVQADAMYRLRVEDVGRLKVRNADGQMVPLATLLTVKEISGPAIVNHYNLFPSAEVMGNMAPGTSSGQAIALMDELSRQELPPSMGTEWTELTLLQILASEDVVANLIFPLGVVFVFMVLAAKYESWILPMAIILIVPMCLFAAIGTVWALGMDNNIFTQIGMMVLVGLAAKNAILIVEFAKQREDAGEPRIQAIQEACRLRLRPILMTSFAFILGVLPLVRAQGAGAEMRIALGVAVFSGMIGVTFFGLVFTPVFYYVLMWLNDWLGWDKKPGATLPPIPAGPAPVLPAEGPRLPPDEGIQTRPH